MRFTYKKKSKPTVVIAKTKAPQSFKIHGTRSKSKPTTSAVASITKPRRQSKSKPTSSAIASTTKPGPQSKSKPTSSAVASTTKPGPRSKSQPTRSAVASTTKEGPRSKSKPTSSAVASTTNTEAEGEPGKKIVAKKKSDSVELHSLSLPGLTISLPSGASRAITETMESIACKSKGGETPEKQFTPNSTNKSPWGKKAINHANVHSSFDVGQEERFYNDTCHSSNTSSQTSYHYSECSSETFGSIDKNSQSSSLRYSPYFRPVQSNTANREGQPQAYENGSQHVKGRVEQENFTGKRGTSQEQMEEDPGEDFDVNFSHNGDYSDREGDGSNRNDYGMHRGKRTDTHKDSGVKEDGQGNGCGSSSPREDTGRYTQENRQGQTTKGSSSNINRDGEPMGFEGSQQGGRRPPSQENNLRRYNVTDLWYNSPSSKKKHISAMYVFNNLQNLVNNIEEPTFNTLIWAEILYYKVCIKFQTTHGFY